MFQLGIDILFNLHHNFIITLAPTHTLDHCNASHLLHIVAHLLLNKYHYLRFIN